MMLALRRTAAENATWWQRLFAWATRVRLVSDYCHGGIVINGMMYQVNAARGLHVSTYDPAKWDVYDVLGSDETALLLFDLWQHARYDYIGLLAFVTPWRFGRADRLYCFEWCALCLGIPITDRITPERLLAAALTPARHSAGFFTPARKDAS